MVSRSRNCTHSLRVLSCLLACSQVCSRSMHSYRRRIRPRSSLVSYMVTGRNGAPPGAVQVSLLESGGRQAPYRSLVSPFIQLTKWVCFSCSPRYPCRMAAWSRRLRSPEQSSGNPNRRLTASNWRSCSTSLAYRPLSVRFKRASRARKGEASSLLLIPYRVKGIGWSGLLKTACSAGA